jgi:uncharacterized protein
MNPNPVVWFEIYVQDMPRAKRFYETVFATTLASLAAPTADSPGLEMWAFPMADPASGAGAGSGGALVKMPGFSSGGSGTIVYFQCDDCAIEASRVAKAGGKIQQEKMSIGDYGFVALAHDSEGNMIGLHSMK